MPKLVMSGEEGREIIFEDNPDFEVVLDESYDTSGRWNEMRECVVKRLKDDTHWITYYSRGKTEYQEELPFEFDKEATFHQVEQKEVTVTKWVTIK